MNSEYRERGGGRNYREPLPHRCGELCSPDLDAGPTDYGGGEPPHERKEHTVVILVISASLGRRWTSGMSAIKNRAIPKATGLSSWLRDARQSATSDSASNRRPAAGLGSVQLVIPREVTVGCEAGRDEEETNVTHPNPGLRREVLHPTCPAVALAGGFLRASTNAYSRPPIFDEATGATLQERCAAYLRPRASCKKISK